MANKALIMASGFPRAPLANGIGRYICQLQRITIKFCKSHGSSRGVRDFIETDLESFARQNPGIVVYVKPRRHRSPVIKAEYINGGTDWMSLHNMDKAEITRWINLFRTQSGLPSIRLRKYWHTDYPSVQGPWNPQTNKDPYMNLVTFPCAERSQPLHVPKTATEALLELAKNKT